MIQLLNELSGLIALFALGISIYSVYYTHKQNLRDIMIKNDYWDRYDEYNIPFLAFSILNNSHSAVTIIGIELATRNETPLYIYPNYKLRKRSNSMVPPSYNPYYESRILKRPEVLAPGREASFNYYMDNVPREVLVRVTTKEKLSWHSNTKLFRIQPLQAD